MPPATACVLILLNRNHNVNHIFRSGVQLINVYQYVADMILSLNENGTYKNPPPTDEKARRVQDDEIFHVRANLCFSGGQADADIRGLALLTGTILTSAKRMAMLTAAFSGYFAKIVLHDYVRIPRRHNAQ
jgi:hypothetical protein